MTCDLSDDAQLGRRIALGPIGDAILATRRRPDLSDLAMLGPGRAQQDTANLSDLAMLGHRPGDQVAVLNSTLRGRFIVEGEALVLRVLSADQRLYLVQFADGCVCERFVDPAAQLDPHAYVAALNRQRTAWAAR